MLFKGFLIWVFLLLVFLFNKNSYADNSNFQDSLLNQIIYETDYQQKVHQYLKLIRFLQTNNPQRSVEFCDIALSIAQKQKLDFEYIEIQIEKVRNLILLGRTNDYLKLFLEIENNLMEINEDILWGKYYLVRNLESINISEFAKAMDYALKAIASFERHNDTLSLCKAYNNIGVIYEYTGNSQKSLENYLISLDLCLKSKNLDLLGILYNNIGIIYQSQGNNDMALQYYFNALKYCHIKNDLDGSGSAFSNIANLYHEMERAQDALLYYRKALTIYESLNNKGALALIFNNLGEFYFKEGNPDSALYFYQKGLTIYTELNDQLSIMECKQNLADLYLATNKRNNGLQLLHEIYTDASKFGFDRLKESSAIKISHIHFNAGNLAKAYHYQSIAYKVADSTRIEKHKQDIKLSDLQIDFKNKERLHEEEIEKYRLSKIIEEQRLQKERILFILLFVLVISFSIVFLRNSKKSSRLNKELMRQNLEIEHQKELIEISNLELKEQYSFTGTLLNTIPNPVFYTDRNSFILGCNKAFEDIAGKNANDIIGSNVTDLNVKTLLSCDTTSLFRNPGKELLRIEGTIIFSDKKEHDVICYRNGIVNSENKLIGTLGIIIDITDIRKAERNLKFSQLKLKDALSAKDKFFNIMAHDLKNPFNAILGLTSILTDNYDAYSTDEVKQYVKLVNQSANQVYNLLENLLEWARTQSGSIEKTQVTFPINDIVMECINLFGYSLEQKKLQVQFETSTEYLVYADQNMTRTVLRNLLSNAIKYSFDNSKITIAIKKENENLSISIIDTGQGIKPENIDKLFKIDQPLSTPGINNERGTGLGLIICQEFVKQNNGSIRVKSEFGKGSTFSFTLPLV